MIFILAARGSGNERGNASVYLLASQIGFDFSVHRSLLDYGWEYFDYDLVLLFEIISLKSGWYYLLVDMSRIKHTNE